MPDPDPFEILGISRTATPDEIRAAYRNLAARYHPDKHRGNPLETLAAEKLAQINWAYEKIRSGNAASSVRSRAAPAPAHLGAKVFRTLLVLIALWVLLRFGAAMLGVVLTLLRAVFGLLWRTLGAVRGSPIALIAFVFVLALALRWALRRRRRG
jgi:preprotein translocase subunit Sec63